MAQEQMRRTSEKEIISGGGGTISLSSNRNTTINGGGGRGGGGFKFNAQAAEFVPRAYTTTSSCYSNEQVLSTGYFYPCVQFLHDGDNVVGTPTKDWYYVDPSPRNNNNSGSSPVHPSNVFSNSLSSQSVSHLSPSNSLAEDPQLKITKQVEYLFSDLSLVANDTMAKHVSKDPEGFVPIPVIAAMKKIKVLVTDSDLLIQALRSSTKLVMSKDSRKVKRRSPFTESYRDELQCRTVTVENLPNDHSYQNLEKIFSVVGCVKAIRLCHPTEANPSRSKNEVVISNKLHALVEYESAEIAERAAEKLNDERDWRKGMRVRIMQRRTPKSILKSRKSDFDLLTDDDELSNCGSPKETSQSNGSECVKENTVGEETSGVSRKLGSPRGRVKTKGRAQCLNDRSLLSSPVHTIGASLCDTLSSKPNYKGPRMPDGTRGFTMGRGKPLISSTPSSPVK